MHKWWHHISKLLVVVVFVTTGITFCHPTSANASHGHDTTGDVAIAEDIHIQDTHCQDVAKSNGTINEDAVGRTNDVQKMLAQIATIGAVPTVQLAIETIEGVPRENPDPSSLTLESSTVLRC